MNLNLSLLSAYLLYKNLYDKNNDTYNVIVEFIKFVIKEYNKIAFNSLEIKQDLKKEFSFDIPESVIKTALKRLKKYLKKEDGEYKIINNIPFTENLISSFQQYTVENNKYLNDIINFLKEKTNKPIEKEQVIQSLQYYIIDNNVKKNEYSVYIAEYLIKNKNKIEKWLNGIKEGFLLYSALEYEDILNQKKVFDKNLTFFLDTEILFHALGYNGKLYEKFFDDFYSLCKEANRNKKKINLKYFTETKEEIELFFKKAENILERNIVVNPIKTAMITILNNCLTKSDIAEKRVSFFNKLKTLGIEQQDVELYNNNNNNYKYNLANKQEIIQISQKYNFNEDEVYKIIENLSKIAKLKKTNTTKNIFETEYLLISENSKYFKIISELKTNMYLLTHLDFVINRFWLKLQKSLKKNTPLSLDTITKAKIVISNLVSDNLLNKFEILKKDYYQKNRTEEELALAIIEFKEKALKPEEINSDNAKETVEILESNIEGHIKQQQFYKNELENEKNKTINLQKEVENLSKVKRNLEQQNQKEKNKIDKLKKKAKKKALTKYKLYKFIFCCVFVCFYIIAFIIVNHFGKWDILISIVGLVPLIELFMAYILLIFLEKEINPKKAFLNHLYQKKKKYLQDFYSEYEINFYNKELIK